MLGFDIGALSGWNLEVYHHIHRPFLIHIFNPPSLRHAHQKDPLSSLSLSRSLS